MIVRPSLRLSPLYAIHPPPLQTSPHDPIPPCTILSLPARFYPSPHDPGPFHPSDRLFSLPSSPSHTLPLPPRRTNLSPLGDLEGSTGLKVIHKNHPDVFIPSGIMERGNFSAAAGFGFDGENQGIFSTFSAFLEMIVSEITMARLNNCNVLSHFSHSGGEFSI